MELDLQPIDEGALDLQPVEDNTPPVLDLEPVLDLQPVEDNGKGRLRSAGAAFMQAGGVGAGQSIAGLVRLVTGPGGVGATIPADAPPETIAAYQAMIGQIMAGKDLLGAPLPADYWARQRQEELEKDPFYRFGLDLAEGAREAYQPNPKFKGEFFTDVLPSGGGQMVPTLAAGMINPGLAAAQYGLSSGEGGAQESIAAGDLQDADKAFLAYLGLGGLSELALGVPANVLRYLRAARANKVAPETARKTVLRLAAEAGVKEAGQEGLEQLGQNLVAQQTFDPDRRSFENVPESMAAGLILGGVAGGGAAAVGRAGQKPAPQLSTGDPQPFSEFGSDTPEPLDLVEIPSVTTAEAAPIAAPESKLNVTETMPEAQETLSLQLELLHKGKRPAVLFTPGEALPKWATEDPRFERHETAAGTFVYDTAQLTREQIDQAVATDAIGNVLGYGIAHKPEPGTEAGVVVVRNARGVEKQAVVTDAANLASVMQAAQRVAGEGDTIRLERAEDVLAWRKAAVEAGQPKETDQQRFAREQREAMAALRKQTGLDLQPIDEPAAAAPIIPTERVQPGVPMQTFERPRDVLDDIEENWGGVQIPPDPDYDWVREQIRELSQSKAADLSSAKLKGLFRGEAPDNVLQGLNKFETPDELFRAMIDAAKARVAWAQQEKAAAKFQPRALDVADPDVDPWQETIDRLNSLKLDTHGQLHAFGLIPEAWNLLIELAKVGVKTGRTVAEAIDWAISEVKRRYTEPFDENGAREHLLQSIVESGGEPRGTGVKISNSRLSPETKAAIEEYVYTPRSNATDEQLADELVGRIGVDQAWEVWKSPPPDLAGAVRTKLLRAITRTLAAQEREARQAQDHVAAQSLVDRQAEIWDEALPIITDLAQSFQAMRDMLEMSPDAQVARAKREMDRAAAAEVDRRRGEVDQVRHAIEQGRADGVEAVRADAEVNAAARAAVDQAITQSEETRRAVILDLARPWSESPTIVAHARAQVQAKANELLNKAPRPAGLTPAQHLRQILDDLAARAASIFGGHIQGADPGVPIVQKFIDRLGLDREHAVKLASQLSKEWDKQLEAARKKLDTRIAAARARQMKRETEAATSGAVDRAIRRQLQELNTKLGEVLRTEAARREETGEHVATRIVQASGLTGAKAEALRIRLKARWDELVGEGQRKALAGIEARSGVKVTRSMRNAFDKLVELDRLGAVASDQFFGVVKASLKLKVDLTQAEAKQLRSLVEAAHAAPTGWQQQRAQAKALTYVEHLKGDLGWRDVPMSIWYANIFSAPPTHLANVIGNTFKAMEVLGVEMLKRPIAAPQILRAFVRGAETGVLEAGNVLATGQLEGTRMLKAEPARPLEWRVQQGGWNKVFLPWAVVGRLLAAEDVVPFKAHEEIRWALQARRIAKAEGLRGEMLDRRVDELLHNTSAEWQSAKAQAATEGLSGINLQRRAHEIIEQRREVSMPGSTEAAREYGLRHTFNAEPYGVAGAIAGVLSNMNQKLVVTRFAIPVVRIMANLTNESLNYFPPVGLTRLAIAARTRRLDGKELASSEEMNYAIARAAVGTALFAALALIGADSLDDEDPPLAITGQGPRTRAQREQLRAAGWKPNSLKVGDRYYSYQETQFAIPLNILGNYFDAIRYKNLSQEDGATRVAYTLQMSIQTVLDQRMLSGLADMIDAMHSDSTSGSGKELARFLARPVTSFVVPNAARFVDQVFDPQVYDADDVRGLVLQNIPYARRQNRPALNAFGEAIERPPMERFTTPSKPDALVKLLAKKNAWVPMPNLAEQVVGDKKRGQDYSRAMTPEEYYGWIAESGPEIRRRLTDRMDKIRELPPEEAQALVRKIATEEREKLKERMR